MTVPLALLLLLALGCFLIRFLPRLARRDAIVSDTYFHLYCAELIRSKGLPIPRTFPQVLLPHAYTYPFGYHLFLALFPLPWRTWVERGTGAFFDTLILLAVHATTAWVMPRMGLHPSPWPPLAAAFLYACAPALLRVGSGPRSFSGSPRVPGQALVALAFLGASHAWLTGRPAGLVLSVLAGAVVLFTAKFATQVLALFTLVFGLLVTPWALALLPAMALVAGLLTLGRAFHVLQGALRHSWMYARHLQAVFLYPHITSWRSLAQRAGEGFRHLFTGRLDLFLDWVFQERHPAHLLAVAFPHLLLVPFAWVSLPATPETRLLGAWCVAGLLWFILTRTRPMLFLGEGERYLEATMVPALCLVSLFLARTAPWILVSACALSALVAWRLVRDYLRQFEGLHRDHAASAPVFDTLAGLPSGAVLPVGWVHWQAIQRGPMPVLTHGANIDMNLLTVDQFLELFGNYPYPGSDFEGLLDTYDIRYVLAERSCLHHYLHQVLADPRIFLDRVQLLRESETLLLFRVLPRPEERPPRLLFIADVPNWIFDRHAHTLQMRLADSFDIDIAYQGQPIDEDAYDLIHPLEWNLVPLEQIRQPRKWVTGIRSHISWNGLTPAQLSALLAPKFAAVYVVSKRLQDLFRPYLTNLCLLPHGLDLRFFHPNVGVSEAPGALRLGWAGNRKSPAKGFEAYIEPLAQLPGVSLHFCGYSDTLLDQSGVRDFYERIDVYVCSSSTEGHNNSLMEAAAMGRALITTDVGTVPEWLVDGESALIVPRTPEAFEAAVARLRDDPALRLRLGQAARKAVTRYDWKLRAEDHRKLFQLVLEAAGSAHPLASTPVPAPLTVPAAQPAPTPTAFLFEPDWQGSDWVEILLAYLDTFRPGDPVALVIPLTPEGPTSEEVGTALMDVAQRAGHEAFADIALVDRPEELLDTLRSYPVILRLETDRQAPVPDGPARRLQAARLRLAQA